MTKENQSEINDSKPLRVLIVEDSEDDALLIIHELKKGGYNPVSERVETSGNMQKALRDKSWDIILCDYKMPKFSGLHAIAVLKETKIDIPIIIISGTIGEETAVECMRLGAHDYFMKGKLSRLCLAINRELTETDLINKRKKAETARHESEERYRMIFNNAPLGVMHFDANGTIIDFNDNFTQIMGAPREKIIGFNMMEQLRDQAMLKAVKDALKGKRGYYEGDYKSITGEKTTSMRAIYQKITAGDGMFLGAVGIFEDITKIKLIEEERKELQERLQRAEKMESLGLLAAGVAHDLNNVLGIVVGYSELLLNGIDEKSPLKKDLTTIFDGSIKAAEIVNDLLALARRGVVGKKVLNLNKLIADFLKSPDWEKLLTYHPHVQIKTDLESDLLNISGSSVHLEKTLYNLISNACEAMNKGGTLTVKTANQYLDKPISGYDKINAGDYVVLSVSDTGEGISGKDLKRIFEPFYTKKIMGRSGTGLGLAVVWGTVKDHQGYIDVQSKEGKGTTFTLYFLITREDIPETDIAVSMSEYLGNGQSILIVDDVKDQRDLASRLLTSLNYQVSSVPSGEEAIEYLKEYKADLLVLDMLMDPGMDGLDTYKSILKINPKQKAIIVSGFSESDRVRDAQVLGAGTYIKKPYIQEKLGMAVKKELTRK